MQWRKPEYLARTITWPTVTDNFLTYRGRDLYPGRDKVQLAVSVTLDITDGHLGKN